MAFFLFIALNTSSPYGQSEQLYFMLKNAIQKQ